MHKKTVIRYTIANNVENLLSCIARVCPHGWTKNISWQLKIDFSTLDGERNIGGIAQEKIFRQISNCFFSACFLPSPFNSFIQNRIPLIFRTFHCRSQISFDTFFESKWLYHVNIWCEYKPRRRTMESQFLKVFILLNVVYEIEVSRLFVLTYQVCAYIRFCKNKF